MSTFIFDFDITGRCAVSTEANSIDEAIENVICGKSLIFELVEWDAEVPSNESIIKKLWANKSDFKENENE
jgi:hypothetical protein